ncbi:MAG: DEAD/DEAH box helicase, partial [Flavobacteriales bacterium]|nr:DEAD/DEAH box helicase [Flavobacteriales bacterium]
PITFSDLRITRQFLNALEEVGFHTPTEIQLSAIPRIMGGQDVIGIAQTGTGKTAAYLLPVLQTLKFAQGEEPRFLILVPTKELAVQVEKQFLQLAKYTDLRGVALYGGIGPSAQKKKCEEGVDVIIATPGRFLEIYATGSISCKKIKHMVIDECDRMMDMGFWPQLRAIQEKIPGKKQQLLFSATFPEKVQRIADNFMLFPHRIEITPQATPAATVEQWLYHVPNQRTKLALMEKLLQDETLNRVLVFVHTRETATAVSHFLERSVSGGVRVLHSNKAQNARLNALEAFRNGEVRILVSTDVSARGIDVAQVSHVINFNVPTHYEDYVHRIGRTGRALMPGVAITLADEAERLHIRQIEKLIHQQIPQATLPPELNVFETSREEQHEQLKTIDHFKRMADPTFKGAFHEKTRKRRRRKTVRKKKSGR